MSENLYDVAQQKEPVQGCFSKDFELNLRWLPEYIDDFPKVIADIDLKWEKCRFLKASRKIIPDKHGVYCFSLNLGSPFPDEIHLPMYIGKAAPGYLSERFDNYFKEKNSRKGRSKIVPMLNKYQNCLFFWWATLPRLYVETVEEHLLMCCKPPCNEAIPSSKKLWGKAFD